MASPFPGMDPYLEAPDIWRGFHHLLADEIIAQLNTALSPRYYADVEVRTVLEEVGVATTKTVYPDTAVLESVAVPSSSATAVAIPAAPIQRLAMLPEEHKTRTVQVRETATDTLVTTIEILSPVNKRGEGLYLYRAKRKSLLRTSARCWRRYTSGRRMPGVLTTPCQCRLPRCVRKCSVGSPPISHRPRSLRASEAGIRTCRLRHRWFHQGRWAGGRHMCALYIRAPGFLGQSQNILARGGTGQCRETSSMLQSSTWMA